MAVLNKIPPSIGIYGNKKNALKLLSRIWGKHGIFTCTVANTLTSTIPGISDAGDTPELTLFTGPADAELLSIGRTICINGIPINPGGIPTPAILTMAALQLSDISCFIINGGCKIIPHVPFFDVGATYGKKITTGKAVNNVKKIFENGKILGKILAKNNKFLVVSESCAGGTTTALAVMLAMGVIKDNIVGSSSPNNPKKLKTELVADAFNVTGIEIGDLRHKPLKAIELVGDPMQAVNAGIVIGASETIPVIAGGGTQMSAVIAIAKEIEPKIIGNIIHGTTRWMVNDTESNICAINDCITNDIPLVYVDMDYSKSQYDGLRAYERGYIKEGVGCGGACIAAIASSSGKIDCSMIYNKVQEIYYNLISKQNTT